MTRKKKPTGSLVRSSAAEYLTFVAASGAGGVEAVYADENVWLSQKMMAQLYDVEVSTINYHLKKVFEDSELEEGSVIRNFQITAADGKTYDTKHYNLSAIIAVGYKVNSERAVQFHNGPRASLQDAANAARCCATRRRDGSAGEFHCEHGFEIETRLPVIVGDIAICANPPSPTNEPRGSCSKLLQRAVPRRAAVSTGWSCAPHFAHECMNQGTRLLPPLSPPANLGTSFTGSPESRGPPRTGSPHGPQARSRVAAGDECSELALDGDEDHATEDRAGGPHVAGGRWDPGPVAPVVSRPSRPGGDTPSSGASATTVVPTLPVSLGCPLLRGSPMAQIYAR